MGFDPTCWLGDVLLSLSFDPLQKLSLVYETDRLSVRTLHKKGSESITLSQNSCGYGLGTYL